MPQMSTTVPSKTPAPGKYEYQVVDANGTVRKGTLEADSESAVVARLVKQGYTPLSVTAKSNTGLNREIKLPQRIGLKDVALMSRQAATMIGAGLSLLRVLSILTEQTRNRTLADALRQVRNDVETGSTFSEALAQHPRAFPPLMVNMGDPLRRPRGNAAPADPHHGVAVRRHEVAPLDRRCRGHRGVHRLPEGNAHRLGTEDRRSAEAQDPGVRPVVPQGLPGAHDQEPGEHAVGRRADAADHTDRTHHDPDPGSGRRVHPDQPLPADLQDLRPGPRLAGYPYGATVGALVQGRMISVRSS